MTKLNPTNGYQSVTESMPKARRVTETAERRSIERTSDTAPLLNRAIHRKNWEMFWIWSFVVVMFAALFFCFWAILAKCRGDWPF